MASHSRRKQFRRLWNHGRNYLYSYSHCHLSVFLFPPFFLSVFFYILSFQVSSCICSPTFLRSFSILYVSFLLSYYSINGYCSLSLSYFRTSVFFSRQLVNWTRYKMHTSHNLHYPTRWHILIHVVLPSLSFPATANCARLQTCGYVTITHKSTFHC